MTMRPNARRPRPQTWRSGPDLQRHEQYISWGRSRAQAHFRGEVWQLTYEDYVAVWGDRWHLRGRTGESLCLTRLDSQGPWNRDNAVIRNRTEVLKAQGQDRRTRRDEKIKKNRSSFVF